MVEELNLVRDGEAKFSDLSSYLQSAYLAIAVAARPLHTRDILEIIDKFKFHDNIFAGETPHKTMNARLSENIVELGVSSVFCRTGPNVFSLRHFERRENLPTSYERHRHFTRTKRVTSENVLVAPVEILKRRLPAPFSPFPQFSFDDFGEIIYFKFRPDAENDFSIKQFVTYSLVRRDRQYLIFRRGKYSNPSEHLRDTFSIAFGGHVTDHDFDLFVDGNTAFLNNSSRELFEELNLPEEYRSIDAVTRNSEILGFINVDDNSDARQHVAVVIVINYTSDILPESGELGIRDVQWASLDEISHNKDAFDLWSRYIIERLTRGLF